MIYDVLVGTTLADLINGVNLALAQGWLIEPGFFVAVDSKLVQYFQPMSFTPATPLPTPGLVVAAGADVEVFEDGSHRVKPKEVKK